MTMDTNSTTPLAAVLEATQARVNITWNRQTGDLREAVDFEARDEDIRRWAEEAVRGGSVPGITADSEVNFADFQVERIRAVAERPWNVIQLRPKTSYGA